MAADLSLFLPELALIIFAALALIAAVYLPRSNLPSLLMWGLAALGVILTLIVFGTAPVARPVFDGLVRADAYGQYARGLILLAMAAIAFLSEGFLRARGFLPPAFPALMALSTAGMLIAVSVADFVALVLSVELMVLAFTALAALRRDAERVMAATYDFFSLSMLGTAVMVLGVCLIFAAVGETGFDAVADAAEAAENPMLALGLICVLAALAFRLGLVPFYAPNPALVRAVNAPVGAFMACVLQFALVLVLGRFMFEAGGSSLLPIQQALAVLALLTLVWAGVMTAARTNIKVFLNGAALLQFGFALAALATGTMDGLIAMLMVLTISLPALLGAYAVALSIQRDGGPATELSAMTRLSASRPGAALAMLVLLLSLAGLPPLTGFFAKLSVILALFEGGQALLLMGAALAILLGGYAHLKLIQIMYLADDLDEPLDEVRQPALPLGFSLAALMMVLGIANLFGIETAVGAAASALVN